MKKLATLVLLLAATLHVACSNATSPGTERNTNAQTANMPSVSTDESQLTLITLTRSDLDHPKGKVGAAPDGFTMVETLTDKPRPSSLQNKAFTKVWHDGVNGLGDPVGMQDKSFAHGGDTGVIQVIDRPGRTSSRLLQWTEDIAPENVRRYADRQGLGGGQVSRIQGDTPLDSVVEQIRADCQPNALHDAAGRTITYTYAFVVKVLSNHDNVQYEYRCKAKSDEE